MTKQQQSQEFDLIVLGGGPAGVQAAMLGGFFGKRTALVERRREIGGALVNTGTLPSKTLRETALTLSGVRARRLQVEVSLRREATVADFMRHERSVGEGERERLTTLLDETGVQRFTGIGRFADPHTIEIDRTEAPRMERRPRNESLSLRGEVIMIATGSSPVRPPEFPFEHPRVYDSDEILSLQGMPRRMAVVGAGVIGSEYACTFAALGTEVHLIDKRDVLLPFLDREISQALIAAMERNGIAFHWKEGVTECVAPQEGDIRLKLSSGETLEADSVLVASGRRSNTGDLVLEQAGLQAGERGLIEVDESYRTAVPHIYAVGDVIGFPALASTSQEQARLAVCAALSLPFKREISKLLPTGVYTIPEVTAVGETEEQLRERGEDYVVGRARSVNNLRGSIIGDREGLLKLLFRRSDMKLLGVHMIGELATEIVHVGLMTMICDGGAEELNHACFNVPTLADLYKMATYRAQVMRDRPELLRDRP